MLKGIVTWAEIDLDAIAYNVEAFKRHAGKDVEVMAVVKANAYGHGAVPVARAALEAGATRLAVNRAIEGVELRKAGIQAPILLLGYTPPSGAELVAQWKLTPSLMTLEFAQALSARAQALGTTLPVHVKIDSGMSRYGLMPEEAVQFMLKLRELPGLYLEGMFTHFATADATDLSWTRQQLEAFKGVLAAANQAGISIPLPHAANSAASMRLPEAHFKAIRLGISMYGLTPSDECPLAFELRPALSLKSTVGRVRVLPAGAGISYGRTFVTDTPTPVALVPVGYGDGYHRLLSNQASVLIHGQRCRILGRVCMDQFVVDIRQVSGVQQDDEVVLIGRQGNEQIPAEEIARLAQTINYEVTTSLLPRVARVYLRDGQTVETNILGID